MFKQPQHIHRLQLFQWCRWQVGVAEQHVAAVLHVAGPGAAAFLDRLMTNRMPKPGRIVLTPMLNEFGWERGITAGMVVSDRVLPYLNIDAVEATGLRIKPFFLKIAERYETH